MNNIKIIFLIILSFQISFISSANKQNIIYVDNDGSADYTTIQDAVNNALVGDTIFVFSGIYHENVIIDKSINLTGEDKSSTIIDASHNGSVITVKSNSVIVNNFTLQYSGDDFWNSGVEIRGSYCTVDNNIIKYNRQGIKIFNNNAYISNNIVTENWLSHPYSGAGIDCGGDNAVIFNNIIYRNLGSGFEIWHSDNLIFKHNLVKENTGSGVRYTNCEGAIFTENIFIDNNGHGIQFTCAWNECESINRNAFISNDKVGLKFDENGCPDISENNFIENGENAVFSYLNLEEQKRYPCIWKNNYWDDWIGFGPKVIWGGLKRNIPYGQRSIPFPNFDWNPAMEPYDITI